MGTIYKPESVNVTLLQSEVTSYPTLRQFGKLSHEDVAQGEFVGLIGFAGGNRVMSKIVSEADAVVQAKNALMRIDDNSNTAIESGAGSFQKGMYEAETQLYVTGETYTTGQELTVREGGLLGPVLGSTTHVNATVEVPPANSAKGTPMEVTVFLPRPKAA